MGILLLYLFFLFVGLIIKIKSPKNKLLQYFCAFLPSWKFFEAPGDSIKFCVMSELNQAWHEISFHIPFSKSQIIFNPMGNDQLARRNLLEHLIEDVQNLEQIKYIDNLTSYQLVKNLAAIELARFENQFDRFKFKVLINDQQEFLISDWCQV